MERYKTLFLTERGLRHQQDSLAAAPPELDVVMLRQPTRAELLPELADAVFLISERTGIIDAEMMAAAPRLRLILRLGSLAYDIDLAAARQAGIAVSIWPLRSTIMVAEHLVMQMLALAKHLRETQSIALATGDWGPSRRTNEDTFAFNWSGRDNIGGLWQKTVGILGFGEIGAELARRLRGWECTLLYNRRRRLPPIAEAELGITFASQNSLLAESDFVVNLLPFFPETAGILGSQAFAVMKPGAFLASCGSGSVIDEPALAEALREGRLAGAALDTYEWEPLLPDNPLRLLAVEDLTANILLTPHVAAGSIPGGVIALRANDYVPILQFLHGEPLHYRLA